MTTETIEAPGTQDTATQTSEQTPPHSEVIVEPVSTETKADEPAEKKPETPRWAQKRIDQLTAKARQAEARAYELEQQLTTRTTGSDEPVDIDTLASRKAAEIVKRQQFDAACNEVHKVGVSEFKEKFAPAIFTLKEVTGSDAEFQSFLEAVVDQTTPSTSAEMLVYFAENPDEASAFADLNPRAQGREIQRITDKLASKKTASASKAPAPVSTVSGTGRASNAAAGTDDETEWYARREAEVRKSRR